MTGADNNPAVAATSKALIANVTERAQKKGGVGKEKFGMVYNKRESPTGAGKEKIR